MESVEVDGLRIAYERAGHGPRSSSSTATSATAPTWRSSSKRSATSSPSSPGTPRSRRLLRPPESFGISGYADALAGFITRLGLESPHVAGLSFGGILALALSGRHPGIPRTLILASAYAGWSGSSRRRGHCASSRRWPVGAVARRVRGHAPPDHALRGNPARAGGCLRGEHAGLTPTGFRALARASAESVRDVLPHVHVPTLLVHGDQDVRAPSGRRGPPCRDRRVEAGRPPGAGHACNIEAPAAFDQAVRAFLLSA